VESRESGLSETNSLTRLDQMNCHAISYILALNVAVVQSIRYLDTYFNAP
jgi:hypothetical protein